MTEKHTNPLMTAPFVLRDERERNWVRSEFDPEVPVLIDVTGPVWSAIYEGSKVRINWDLSPLNQEDNEEMRWLIAERLVTRSLSYMNKINLLLRQLKSASEVLGIRLRDGIGEVSAGEWLRIWDLLSATERSTLRSIYRECADRRISGTSRHVADEMMQWKARNDVDGLKDVKRWHPTKGSLTTAETEILRRHLVIPCEREKDFDKAIRLFGWILMELPKRSSQILSIKKDQFHELNAADPQQPGSPNSRSETEYFLEVPKVKAQTGRAPEWWQISSELGQALAEFGTIPSIEEAQNHTGLLLPMTALAARSGRTHRLAAAPVALAGSGLSQWAKRRGLKSPRTGELLHVTPQRLRHTGATGMALQGASSDEIQYVLEHDSTGSCSAYLQSVSSDLIPVIERADRSLGQVFSSLKKAFFKGYVVPYAGKRPVRIPVKVESPAIVGGCGKQSACATNPFWSCYDQCPHFLAWREGDHRAALSYVENELARWDEANSGPHRSKAKKDFDRIAKGIQEVIDEINETRTDGGHT